MFLVGKGDVDIAEFLLALCSSANAVPSSFSLFVVMICVLGEVNVFNICVATVSVGS